MCAIRTLLKSRCSREYIRVVFAAPGLARQHRQARQLARQSRFENGKAFQMSGA